MKCILIFLLFFTGVVLLLIGYIFYYKIQYKLEKLGFEPVIFGFKTYQRLGGIINGPNDPELITTLRKLRKRMHLTVIIGFLLSISGAILEMAQEESCFEILNF